MNAVQSSALKRAVAMLNAVSAKYYIEDADGNVTATEGLEAPHVRKRARPQNNFRKTGYIETLVAMQPGDTVTFTAPEDLDASKFQSAICGQASSRFGKGNYITKKTGTSIELLRVA